MSYPRKRVSTLLKQTKKWIPTLVGMTDMDFFSVEIHLCVTLIINYFFTISQIK